MVLLLCRGSSGCLVPAEAGPAYGKLSRQARRRRWSRCGGAAGRAGGPGRRSCLGAFEGRPAARDATAESLDPPPKSPWPPSRCRRRSPMVLGEQERAIPSARGRIRGLLIDSYFMRIASAATSAPISGAQPDRQGRHHRTWSRRRSRRRAAPRPSRHRRRGRAGMYLCHGFASSGRPRSDCAALIRDFLDANSDEVARGDQRGLRLPGFRRAMRRWARALRLHPAADGEWPTLGEMIDSGQPSRLPRRDQAGRSWYPRPTTTDDGDAILPRRRSHAPPASRTCRNAGPAEVPSSSYHWSASTGPAAEDAAKVIARPLLAGARVQAVWPPSKPDRGQLLPQGVCSWWTRSPRQVTSHTWRARAWRGPQPPPPPCGRYRCG